jgi:uncharacterized protein YfiM (DUF2279 family)
MGNVLSPFSSEFWDAAGEEIGSEKNWKESRSRADVHSNH